MEVKSEVGWRNLVLNGPLVTRDTRIIDSVSTFIYCPYLKSILILTFDLRLGFPRGLLPVEVLKAFLTSSILGT